MLSKYIILSSSGPDLSFDDYELWLSSVEDKKSLFKYLSNVLQEQMFNSKQTSYYQNHPHCQKMSMGWVIDKSENSDENRIFHDDHILLNKLFNGTH